MSQKQTIQQLPIPERTGHNAILHSSYLEDVVAALSEWKCHRVVLVHSKALDANSSVINDLKYKLGDVLVGTKSGVGAHSPYSDVIAITNLLHEKNADCLISIGSSSYSDACKVARLLHSSLSPGLTAEHIEATINQEKGLADKLKDPKVKLIVVPTSLSASEWNHVSSATSPEKKKQHFASAKAAPDLILLDPEVAATSPRILWLSSGMRAVDHCVETICNPKCTPEAAAHMEEALSTLLKGLQEYKEGEVDRNREELLRGIAECQLGSRQAMMGLLINKIPMGPSHAIGHQLGSVGGVMHGVTSCIMLGPVLRYTMAKLEPQTEPQNKVLQIFNNTLGWDEKSAADAVERFVRFLELPNTLVKVGVTRQDDLDTIAEKTMTDVWGGGEKQISTKEEVIEVLKMAKGG
ncbi:alcohol dehydrogenase [Lophiotrema nucula]|uniref:Alcohol dehydrogenase n=1 Tax=Lophiotrema nucula TaxID=690887 RepID=A0A6A5YWS6_9PLEO|nr:alcohol dehydrogenase [Lophiotrema nucula]